MDFIGRLRTLRESQGLTTREVAARVGVTKSVVSRWENGDRRPSYEDLERWGRALGVEVDIVVRDPNPHGEAEELTDAQAELLGLVARVAGDIPDDKIDMLLAMVEHAAKRGG